MKNKATLSVTLAIFALFFISQTKVEDFDGKPNANTSPSADPVQASIDRKMSPDNLLPAEVCVKVKGMIARAFPYDDFNNAAPGILYMPTRAWTGIDGDQRQMIGQTLAFQKACEDNVNPNTTTVEVRSIDDNKVLARGMYWELKNK